MKRQKKKRAQEATNAAVVHHGKQNDESPRNENTNDMQIISSMEESHKPITKKNSEEARGRTKAICDEIENVSSQTVCLSAHAALDDLVDAACQTKLYSHG